MILALVGVSMPIFWLGLMLVNLFSVQLGWLPALGMGSMSKGIGDGISHMVLPCFCLATIPTATFARITRSSMLEVIPVSYTHLDLALLSHCPLSAEAMTKFVARSNEILKLLAK